MRFEQGDESLREGTRAYDADVESHVHFLPRSSAGTVVRRLPHDIDVNEMFAFCLA